MLSSKSVLLRRPNEAIMYIIKTKITMPLSTINHVRRHGGRDGGTYNLLRKKKIQNEKMGISLNYPWHHRCVIFSEFHPNCLVSTLTATIWKRFPLVFVVCICFHLYQYRLVVLGSTMACDYLLQLRRRRRRKTFTFFQEKLTVLLGLSRITHMICISHTDVLEKNRFTLIVWRCWVNINGMIFWRFMNRSWFITDTWWWQCTHIILNRIVRNGIRIGIGCL